MDVPLSLQTRPNSLTDPWFGLHHPTPTATSGGSTTLLKRCPIMLREEVVSDILFSFLLGDLIKWAIQKKETMTNQMSTRCRLPSAESPMNFHFQCHKDSLNQEQCEGLYLRVNDPSYATAFRTTTVGGPNIPLKRCLIILRQEVVSVALFFSLLGDLIKWATQKKEIKTK